MKFIKLLLLIATISLLTGCPTDFEELEEDYYKDRFFEAATQLRLSSEDPSLKENTDEFIKRNGRYFKRRLISEVQQLFKNPNTDAVETLRILNEDLEVLSTLYPDLFSEEFVELSKRTYTQLLNQFSNRGVADIQNYLRQSYYRSAFEELELLHDKLVLPKEWLPVKDQMAPLMPRALYIYPPKVHDLSIEDLRKQYNADQRFDYELAPKRLYANAMNIPVHFKENLKTLIKKHSSSYLNLGNKTEADYYVQYRVGYSVDEDIIESRKEITSTFRVQYTDDTQWYNKEMTFEAFVQTRTVHIIVDAQVLLANNDKVIARYMFESLMPQEKYSAGKIISDQNDVVNIDYPEDYKQYKYGRQDKTLGQLTEHALEDAALVLTYKVLDTIDVDPDPIFIQSPPALTIPN